MAGSHPALGAGGLGSHLVRALPILLENVLPRFHPGAIEQLPRILALVEQLLTPIPFVSILPDLADFGLRVEQEILGMIK